MTTERDLRLEHEIRAAFAEIVPPAADPALATSIRATVARTPRVRPGLTFGGRSASAAGWLAAVAIVVVVAVLALPLITSTGRDGPSANPGQVVGTSPSPRGSAEPEASPSPTAAASPTVSAPLPAGVIPVHKDMFGDLDVREARLVTDSVGWVATDSLLYRTEDGGKSWTELQMPREGAYASLAVVDGRTAYVAYTHPSTCLLRAWDCRPVAIWATDDGGKSWGLANFDDAYTDGYPLLSFRTPLIGSVTFIGDKAGAIDVFHTSDGGRTWVGPFASTLPDDQVKTTPNRGGILSLNVGQADGVPFSDHLWLSADGGQTWPKRSFPIDQAAPAGTLKWVTGTPLVDGYGRIVLPIAVGGGPNALYESTDDGQTWRLLKTWEQPTVGDYAWQALSDSTWVQTNRDGSEIWSTTNGGAVWRRVAGDARINELEPSWASTDHGWGFHRCNRDPFPPQDPDPYCDGNQLKSVLLETTDGGQTWTPLGG